MSVVVASSSPTKLCLDAMQSRKQILHCFGGLCLLRCTIVASSVAMPCCNLGGHGHAVTP